MLSSDIIKPLGLTLQEADLVSKSQIELALLDRSSYPDLKIGDILVLRGWIEQNTVDFFAEKWNDLVQKKARYSLGYYLQQANLLQKEQINVILKEQNQLWLRFGSIAVLKGWLRQGTLDFFLQSLFPSELASSPFIGKRNSNLDRRTSNHEQQISLETSLNHDREKTVAIDYEDIPWVD